MKAREGAQVVVNGRFGAWRGVITCVYPDGIWSVQPTEPGRGWSRQPVQVRRELVELVPMRALRLVEGGVRE